MIGFIMHRFTCDLTTMGVGEPYDKRSLLKAIILMLVWFPKDHETKACHENIWTLTYSYVNIILLNIPTPWAKFVFFSIPLEKC